MNMSKTIALFNNKRELYFKWLAELNRAEKIGLSLCFAAITGICAQIRIPLPWTPVPVTCQVFAVLLSGTLLGSFYAGLSMILYLSLGAVGIPWFAGFRAGLSPGPTLGYLIGFLPAAIFVGMFAHKHHRLISQILIMLIGVLIIYLIGAINFSIMIGTDFSTTLKMAVLPFIPFDIIKAILAGFVSRAILSDDRH
ncbi:MAG: biotin transporter BioY [bacterium]